MREISSIGLLLLLTVTWFNGPGLDRSPAIHRYLNLIMAGIGLVMAYYEDWFVLALWAYVCINAMRFPWPANQLTKVSSAGVLYLLVKIMPQAVTVEMVLMAIVVISLAQCCLYFANRRWSGNPNHTDMLMVMGMACAVALSLIQEQGLWSLAMIPLAAPFVTRFGQAAFWVAGLAIALLFVSMPMIGSLLGLASCVAVSLIAWPSRQLQNGPDHGRIRIWSILLTLWWKTGWKSILFGLGPDSWRSWADSFSRLEQQKTGKPGSGQLFTHPHNEYVHVLFEHGLMGLGLLLGLIGSLLAHAWTVQPALIIPGLTLCAIAFTCFPWTLPYEVGVYRNNRLEYDPFGCIGMVLVSAIIMAIC